MRKALILENWINQVMTGLEAAEKLGVSYRQAKRLKRNYLKAGAIGLSHKNKSKAPANKIKTAIKNKILEVFLDWKRNTDDGLNASHLCDILLRDHEIKVSRITCWRILKS